MSIVTTKAFPQSFDRDISKIYYDRYTSLPSEFDKGGVFKIENAPAGHDYFEAEMTGLGALRILPEGQGIEFDTPAEGHKKQRLYTQYGLGFQITVMQLADDLFGNWKKLPQSLAKSAAFKREVIAWAVLNGAFSSALQTAWDDLAICTTHTHLKSASTYTNNVAVDLSDTALKAAFQYFDDMLDPAGFPLLAKLKTLVINPEDKWMANDLLMDTGRVWDYSTIASGLVSATVATGGTNAPATSPSAAGLKNFLNPSMGIVDDWKVFVCHWLTDADSWFALGEDADLRLLWKEKPGLSTSEDWNTDAKLFKTVMRLVAFCNDPSQVYGSTGAG